MRRCRVSGAGGGSLGSQDPCQIKLVPLTIAGYQALTGDNTTQPLTRHLQHQGPSEAPGIVLSSPVVTHTGERGLTLTKFNVESGLRRPGPGEAAWHREAITTHRVNGIISRECQCYASSTRCMQQWLGHCSTVTADWCITADTHLLHNILQTADRWSQCPHWPRAGSRVIGNR